MAYIKKLKNNELIGGTDNTDVYPITSTQAVYDGNNTSQEYLNNHITTDRVVNSAITNPKLADSAVSMDKLDTAVKTLIQQGASSSWTPKGTYSATTKYDANDAVYEGTTNSSYLSLKADNLGHAVTDTEWWMVIVDGSDVNTLVAELQAGVEAAIAAAQEDLAEATQAANEAASAANAKIDWVTEQVNDLTAYEVATELDETSIIPVQNKVVTEEFERVDDYIGGDVRTLAVGQVYALDEAVKTSDNVMLRMTKEVKVMNTTDAVSTGDLKAANSKTYKALYSIVAYSSSGDYSTYPYAVGRPSAYIITVDASHMTSGGGISVTVGETTVEYMVLSNDTAITIAAAIVSGLGTISGWTITDNEDGTITIKCLTAGANTLTISADTGETGVSISSEETVGANTTSKYVENAWQAASVQDMYEDTNLYQEVEIASLTSTYTRQNNVSEDIFEASSCTEELFDLSAAAVTTNNSTYITPSKTAMGAKWTVIAVNASSRQGQVKTPAIQVGKKYKIRFDYVSTLADAASVALDKYSGAGTGSGSITTAMVKNLGTSIIAAGSSGSLVFDVLLNVEATEYLTFRFPQNTKNRYLEVKNISIEEYLDIRDAKDVLSNISAGESIDNNSDVEISDDKNNVILQLIGGHIKTKNFDSETCYNLDKFKNKHLAIIGDSVSTYSGYIPTDWKTHYTSSNLSSVKLTYWWQLCDALKMTYNNCSYSTSRASGNSEATSVSGGDGECAGCSDVRISALNRDGKTPDIVLIELGINDWANNVSIGTFCEGGTLPAEGVINSFSDAYALMINKIRTLYPTVRIFCCTVFSNLARETTPPFRGGSSPYTSGNALYAYNKAIRDVARIMGCDAIDLEACGINNLSASTTTHDNKVHPNALGFKLMYEKILSEIIAKY